MSEEPNHPNLRIKGRLMSASEIERTLVRLAHQIVEKSNGSEDLALVGIKRRGIPLAERLGKLISGIEIRSVDTGMLDIQFPPPKAVENRVMIAPENLRTLPLREQHPGRREA